MTEKKGILSFLKSFSGETKEEDGENTQTITNEKENKAAEFES